MSTEKILNSFDQIHLTSCVFSPDMENENGCDEYQTHDKHWDWANFESWRVLGVESPHASIAGTADCS